MLTNRYSDQFADLGTNQYSTPLDKPRFYYVNQSLADHLGITTEQIESWLLMQEPHAGFAMKYTGHQFGHYNPDLGDGRGLLLGEWQTQDQSYDLHLKGSGLTPYSRMGDGRAVTRSTIREYLMGEFLSAIGVASTRSLGMASFSDAIQREQHEPAAVLLRTTATHIRFGHFEYLANTGRIDRLASLIDYVGHTLFKLETVTPELLLTLVIERTAKMIAKWQNYGFCHGVMNTDNMSIIGETFDFGPYAFMASFNPSHICNRTDQYGRYAFDQQPSIGLWNLQVLARALSVAPNAEIDAKSMTSQYVTVFNNSYVDTLQRRLGYELDNHPDLEVLLDTFHQVLAALRCDFNQFFALNQTDGIQAALEQSATLPASLKAKELTNRLKKLLDECPQIPAHGNPLWVPRNELIDEVITASNNSDWLAFKTLAEACAAPYAVDLKQIEWLNTGASGFSSPLSCSS